MRSSAAATRRHPEGEETMLLERSKVAGALLDSSLQATQPETDAASVSGIGMPLSPVAITTVDTARRAQGTCDADACSQMDAQADEALLPEAQRRWAARPLADRLQVFRKARHWMAVHPELVSGSISMQLARTEADTLVTELLPLLDGIRFLERSARKILAPRHLGLGGRPLWLAGVAAEVHRDPLGHVLVLGPSNFPLFLPGVQVIQALVAGNVVTWKPGAGGRRVALLLNHIFREAGLPRGVLHITAESAEAGKQALADRPDKVFLTGSLASGQHVLSTLAETVTPATMELSGADAVVVLPSADLAVAAKALSFGLRLNGSEVCMSPRRLVGTAETLRALLPLLTAEFDRVAGVGLKPHTAERLHDLIAKAVAQGAEMIGSFEPSAQRPLLLEHATPAMAITQSDLFAPVLSLIRAPSVLHVAEIVNKSPMGLTAAIFGDAREAAALALELRVGTVLINDLIAPTADPRIPFGGRGRSGYGVTRGAEGLLEMTAPKVILRRRKGLTRHYESLSGKHLPFFAGMIGFLHGGSLPERWRGLQRTFKAARTRSAL